MALYWPEASVRPRPHGGRGPATLGERVPARRHGPQRARGASGRPRVSGRRRASSSSGAPSGLPQDTPPQDAHPPATARRARTPQAPKRNTGIPSISELFEGLVSQEENLDEEGLGDCDDCLGRALEIGYGLASGNAPQVQLVINGCRDVIVRPGEVKSVAPTPTGRTSPRRPHVSRSSTRGAGKTRAAEGKSASQVAMK